MKIAVVGAGIIGCATAWELARAGCAVTLFERATPGAEASSAAAGLLAPLGDTPESAYARLALASWRQYPSVAEELRELTGIDVEYVTRGTIYPLLSVEDVRRTEARVGDRLDPTYGIEVWDAADVRANEPALSTQVRGAMFVGADHWVNNQRLVVAYAQAAIGAGVVLRAAPPSHGSRSKASCGRPIPWCLPPGRGPASCSRRSAPACPSSRGGARCSRSVTSPPF
jgi:glycine oxidase